MPQPSTSGASRSGEDQVLQDRAILSTTAPSLPAPAQSAQSSKVQRIILIRFCQQEDLHMFKQGPVKQLMNDLAVFLNLYLTFAVQPAQKTQTRSG